ETVTLADVRAIVRDAIQDAFNTQQAPNRQPQPWRSNNGSQDSRDQFRQQDRARQRTWDGKPICDYCHKVGHYAVICRKRANDIANKNSDVSTSSRNAPSSSATRFSRPMERPIRSAVSHGQQDAAKREEHTPKNHTSSVFAIANEEMVSDHASIGLSAGISATSRAPILEKHIDSRYQKESPGLPFAIPTTLDMNEEATPEQLPSHAVPSPPNVTTNTVKTSTCCSSTLMSTSTTASGKAYKSAIAEGYVDNIPTSMVIDSGSAATIISRRFYDDYLSDIPLQPSNRSAIVLADNRQMKVLGTC
ncbi:MAG: retropepsin-like aspartic protease, partial [Candidatus Saccharimonadales bacterium]